MESFNIYLAGGMTGLSYKEYYEWREELKEHIEEMSDMFSGKPVSVCNISDYYNFEEKIQDSEREVMEFDLWKVKKSDLLIVNYNSPGSLGTMAEITTAYNMGIPVLGLNENNHKLHSWQECMTNKMFDNMADLAAYVLDFYLI